MTSKLTCSESSVDRPLQRRVLEGDHAPAAAADRVMVVVAAGLDPLVAGGAAGDLEPLHEAELLELLERPVDAGAADRGRRARRSSSSSSSAVTAQSWRASASTTAVRAPPRRRPAPCRVARACSAQALSAP